MPSRHLGAGDAVSLMFNFLIHGVILFLIWAVLFQFLISPLERQALGGTLNNLITSTVQSNINAVPDEVRTYFKSGNNADSVQRIKAYFSTPTAATNIQNDWLTGVSYAVPIIGVVTLGVIFITVSFLNTDLPITHILVENLVTFALVGIVEYELFTQIAIKYSPIKASDVSNTIMSELKTGLNCSS